MRPSPSSLFVVGAMALAAGVGVIAKNAAGAEDSKASALPTDASALGFAAPAADSRVHDVMLLDATRAFRIELTHGTIAGAPPRGGRLTFARAVVTRELARYSRKLLQAIRMRGVVFVDDLHEGEIAIPSLPNVGGLLLFDVSGSEHDLVRGLHHEVFHFADLADDGFVSPDPAWDALNTRGFAYGAGGRTLRAGWAARPPEGVDGFVSAYAMSGVEEDKAETFAFAMARPVETREHAARDPIFAAKLAEMARRIEKLDPGAPRSLGLVR
jgi:hypothetical protein